MEKTMSKRNPAFDLMRILAALAVVMIHTCMDFVMLNEPASAEFLFGNLFDSLSRFAVPLFVMISGALLLDEEKPMTLKSLLGKRIPGLILLLMFWSAVYAIDQHVIPCLQNGWAINPRSVLDAFVFGHFHLWYLYMQLGLYLILPILRAFVKKENKSAVCWLIAVSIFTCFSVPLLRSLSAYSGKAAYLLDFIGMFKLNFPIEYVVYLITGWLVTQIKFSKRQWLSLIALAVLSALALIALVQVTGDFNNAYKEANLLVYFYSVSLFAALYHADFHWSDKAANAARKLSSLSFGVYVIHILALALVSKCIPHHLHPAVLMLARFASASALSFAVCFVLSRIPILKKTIRA